MGPDVESLVVNPLVWLAAALAVLVLELFLVSGVSLAVGVAGLVVGGLMLVLAPETGGQVAVARSVLGFGAGWSLFSLVVVVVLKLLLRRGAGAVDPNEVERGLGVEKGEVSSADVRPPVYEDVLHDYRPRL